MNAMSTLLVQVNEVLEAKFGLTNIRMNQNAKASQTVFYNTSNPRVKVAVQNNRDKVGFPTSVNVTVAVEDEGRPGVFFALGDRLHFDLNTFPQFRFQQDLAKTLSKTAARTDLNGDVLAFAKELTEKL